MKDLNSSVPMWLSADRLHNSWYLKTAHQHRFYCACGQVDIRSDVVARSHHPSHRCTVCGNRRYLDAVTFVTNGSVRYWSPFVWYLRREEDTAGWHISSRVNVPLWDVRQQAVRICAVEVLRYSLNRTGAFEERVVSSLIASHSILSAGYDHTTPVRVTMHKKMLPLMRRWFLRRMPASLHWLRSRDLSPVISRSGWMDLYGFFLRYPHFQEEDPYFWHRREWVVAQLEGIDSVRDALWRIIDRREKSVRRAVLVSYRQSPMQDYDPLADFLFARYVRDPNHLRKLLAISVVDKTQMFEGIDEASGRRLMAFLGHFYTDRAMVSIWRSFSPQRHGSHLVRDTVEMIDRIGMERAVEMFERVAPSLEAVHDAIVLMHARYGTRQRATVRFSYPERYTDAEVEIDKVRFRLPRTSKLLGIWGSWLHNCLASYEELIREGRSVVYGVYLSGELAYAVEIAHHRIVQMSGKYNRPVPEEDQQKINQWYSNYLNK